MNITWLNKFNFSSLGVGFPLEIVCTKSYNKNLKIVFQVKIARNCDIISHCCTKSVSWKFWQKSWFLNISLFPAILYFKAWVISQDRIDSTDYTVINVITLTN